MPTGIFSPTEKKSYDFPDPEPKMSEPSTPKKFESPPKPRLDDDTDSDGGANCKSTMLTKTSKKFQPVLLPR